MTISKWPNKNGPIKNDPQTNVQKRYYEKWHFPLKSGNMKIPYEKWSHKTGPVKNGHFKNGLKRPHKKLYHKSFPIKITHKNSQQNMTSSKMVFEK